MKEVKPLAALTSVRFFAALAVALSHFSQIGLLDISPVFLDFVDGGRPAVSLFFVLSGFILTYNYADKMSDVGAQAFYWARFARVYPVVVLSLLLAAGVTVALKVGHRVELMLAWYALKRAVDESLAASLICQLLLLTAWFPIAAINQPWNGPAWSISCEAFFYALFPWLLSVLKPRRSRNLLVLCVALWIAQGAWIGLIGHTLPLGRRGFMISQFPLTHAFEFVLGICAALAYSRMRAGKQRHLIGMALVTAALVCGSALAILRPLSPAYYLETPSFASLILGLALLERPVIHILNRSWLVTLGHASFALYLIHVPIGRIAYLLGARVAQGWCVFGAAVVASLVVFRCYEEPARRWLLARRDDRRVFPVAAAAPIDRGNARSG